MVRELWIAAVGAGIALGAGNGIAAAESGSTDGASALSSAQSAQSSTPSQTNTGVASQSKDVDKSQDSDGSKTPDKPATTVSAATGTIVHDDNTTVKHVATAPGAPQSTVQAQETTVHPVSSVKTPQQTSEKSPTPDATTSVDPPSAQPVSEVAAPAAAAPAAKSTAEVAKNTTDVAKSTAEVAKNAVAIRSVTASVALAAPVRPTPGPIATVVISLLSAFGLMPPLPPAPVDVVGVPAKGEPGTSAINGVSGVEVGSSSLSIPVGTGTYTGAADWYFPTQADGTVQAQGVMLLQHGFLGSNFWYSGLAQDLAQRTNSIVVVPNIPSFPFFTCGGCTLSDVSMQQGVAALFADPNRVSLNASALAAGYHGALPQQFILTGHSAGGGLATAAGGFYREAIGSGTNDLLGVVMFDGVSSNGTFADALTKLEGTPVYQIAAPPQPWNANGQTTDDLVALRPGQFVGDVLANGSHVDSLIGGNPTIDFFSQLFIRRSPAGNTQAVYTLATGWINDFYAGKGPADPTYGIYGTPDQYLVLGPAAGVVLGPAPVVDLNDYLGTWYEVGSIKQFFSLGLVNTTAFYRLNTDGSIGVENSGNYFFNDGPKVTIVGAALPVDPGNDKLNVTFFGPASATPPGNYWIVDLAPDYSWAIVSDSTGGSGFLLSRTRTVSDALYQELLNRASAQGVADRITRTGQPAANQQAIAV